MVLLTTASLTILAVARLLLMPEAWASSVAALLFLPLVIGGILLRHRARSTSAGAPRIPGKLRAALVGSGILLATALIESMLESRGVLTENSEDSGGILLTVLPALVAVGIDLFSARLERKAEKD